MKIKQYNSDNWGNTLVLVDEKGMPLHFPNRYTFSTIAKRGGSNSAVEKALYVITRLYLWADINKLCVERTLYYGDFLLSDETSDLVDFLQYTSETQNQIASNTRSASTNTEGTDKIIVFKRRGEPTYNYTSNQVYSARLRALQKYLDWVIVERKAQRIQTNIALRWLIGRNSNNWYAAGYRRIRDYCEVHGLSPWDVMNRLESGALTLQHTNGIIIAYNEIVTRITDLEALPDVTTLIDTVFPDGIVEFRDIRTLAIKILTETPDIDVVTLVREVSALISKPEIPTEVQDVRIMSLHKSKGLSAPVTIIAGCVQGLLPRPLKSNATFNPTQAQIASNLEEQRRLFYVGMTRVKAALPDKPGTLILTYSQQMPRATAAQAGITPAGNQYGISVLHASQFIRELGPQAPAPIAG